jgi:type IV secretory pathway VirB2 component (pilin)
MATRYASRKFLLAVAAFLAACAFLLAGKLDAAQWIGFVEWIVGLYMAGNVGDTVAEGIKP